MHLSCKDLYQIEGYVKIDKRSAEIASLLWRHKSVISRLFSQFPRDTFSAEKVIQVRKEVRQEKSREYRRIALDSPLAQRIITDTKEEYSPEQIAGRWSLETKEKLSKDTVYKYIRTHYPWLIKLHFRRHGKKYRNRKQEQTNQKYQIPDRVMIDERPKSVEERKIIGHWEEDTIIGKDRSGAILTEVERKSGYALATILPKGKDAMGVVDAEEKLFKDIPKRKKKSKTRDNGREFAYHGLTKFVTGIKKIYYAHPYSSWERWTNENWNGLLRQYIPKKTDFKTLTEEDLQNYVKKINSRPRKRLGYLTPEEVFLWRKKV